MAQITAPAKLYIGHGMSKGNIHSYLFKRKPLWARLCNRVCKFLAEDADFQAGYGYTYGHPWGLSWLHRAIYRRAWPGYECENCLGLSYDEHHGCCYCFYHGAVAPGQSARFRHLVARWIWKRVRKDHA